MKKFLILIFLLIVCINSKIIINGENIDNSVTSEFNNQVIVVIKVEYSNINKKYDMAYFDDIECVEIKELTSIAYKNIIYNFDADNSINIKEFRRIFCLTLNLNDNSTLYEKIELIKRKIEVEDAFPNLIINCEMETESMEFDEDNYEWWYNGENGISLIEAWNYTKGSDSIIVGIMDTGIDKYHSDLEDNIYNSNENELHADFGEYTNPNDKNPLKDDVGHGTHVAGIIGALNNGMNFNNMEVKGVCQNVTLVSLKLPQEFELYTNSSNDIYISSLIAMINYAASKNIDILNFSGRIFGDIDNECMDNYLINMYPHMVLKGIGYALANYDGLLVCAAGNDGEYGEGLTINNVPAIYSKYSDRVITVGSINSFGIASNFSKNDSQAVSIFAPGEGIISTFPTNLNGLGNYYAIKDENGNNTGYISMSGTSMATPFVTGTAALIKSINSNITAEQIKRVILENANFNADLEYYCFSRGQLNAFKAVSAVVFETKNSDNNGLIINGFRDYYDGKNCIKLVIPESFSPYENCNDITNTIVSNPTNEQKNIKAIGQNAFEGFDKIEIVELPNTISSIGAGAFKNCVKIENVILPTEITTISSSLFEGCTNLKEITIPEGVTTICSSAFKGCTSLESVIIPNTVTTIEASAFEGCTNLKEIKIPEGVTTICSSAFKGCTSLESVIIPNTVTTIEASAFEGCINLKEINLSNSITNIGSSAFEGCTSLEEMVLPSNLTTIENNTFEGCINLKEIEIPEGVRYINGSAFDTCVNLEQITLPNTIDYIGVHAFYGCENIEVIELPDSLLTIETEAFSYCTNLKIVNVNKEGYPLIKIGTNVFKNCTLLSEINVPSDKIAKYKNATNWSSYKNIILSDYNQNSIDVICHISYDETEFVQKGRDLLLKLNIECNCIYNFYVNSFEEINIIMYDSQYNQLNCNVYIEEESLYNINVLLNEGTYYLDIWLVNNYETEEVNINITTDIKTFGYDLLYNIDNNISNHLHEFGANFVSYLKYNNKSGKGLYKLSLTGIDINNLLEGSIKVYNNIERTSLVNCYNISNFDNFALSKNNENTLYLYLEYNNTYYIDIIVGSINNNINVKIEKVSNTYEFSLFNLENLMSNNLIEMLDESDDTSLNSAYFKKVNIKESGIYSTTIMYNGTQQSDIKVVFIKDNGEEGYNNIGIYTLNNSKTVINTNYNKISRGIYYIGYYNLDKSECNNLNVSFRRFTDNDSDSVYNALIVDPNAPGMTGSQINIFEKYNENKSYGETFITKGFTRLIFIDSSFGYSNSRLDYEWYSSDENVLMVTQFGTVLGKGLGTAKIVAINKENPSIMFIKEFNVIDNLDNTEILITINQTYSLSSTDNCTINLNAQNSPYPMIQYYNFEIVACTGTANLDAYGNIDVNNPCNITIEGYYILNCKYKIRIIFEITT